MLFYVQREFQRPNVILSPDLQVKPSTEVPKKINQPRGRTQKDTKLCASGKKRKVANNQVEVTKSLKGNKKPKRDVATNKKNRQVGSTNNEPKIRRSKRVLTTEKKSSRL